LINGGIDGLTRVPSAQNTPPDTSIVCSDLRLYCERAFVESNSTRWQVTADKTARISECMPSSIAPHFDVRIQCGQVDFAHNAAGGVSGPLPSR
jgi:hypothetical protein